jgi:L-glyceraldehyde 3-phosphate reductase
MSYQAEANRYDNITYRRVGKSGLKLPEVSLGLWHNFGDTSRHFDLANNYGPKPGSAETNFGMHMQRDFRGYRDEMIISTKAGYDMWPGPYGEWGSRKYLTASLNQSLKRMQLEYVDIFYSHRFDPNTPLEETMGALASAVQQGKALYVGISSYNSEQTREAKRILAEMGVPLLIHQPRYSMFDRNIETDLLDTLAVEGLGCIVFSPLAQGMLTDRYLAGSAPKGSRATRDLRLNEAIDQVYLQRVRGLNEIAANRGQTLAQLAISWVLRHPQMTSALIGASSVKQLEQNFAAIGSKPLSLEELAQIDKFAIHGTTL